MAIVSNEDTDERSQALIAGIEAIRPTYVLELPSSNLKAVIQHFLEAPGVTTFQSRERKKVWVSWPVWCSRARGQQ